MSRLEEISALVADTTGWLEWISPRATTEIAVVYSDGGVYLPTGGTEEEFAFANARGKVHRLVRADDVTALLAFARDVEALRGRIAEAQFHRVALAQDGIARELDAALNRLEEPLPGLRDRDEGDQAMTEQKHPTQDSDKHSEVAHMIADALGTASMYDDTYDAWLNVQNNYDRLDVTIDFQETEDQRASHEVYRLTVERVQ